MTSRSTAKTGSREAFSLVLYPGYAVVDVPVDETSQREFSWYFDGDWSEFGGAGTSTDDRFSVDQVDGTVIAAVSISGPTGRMGTMPGRRYAPLVMAAGKYLTDTLIKAGSSI